MQFAVAVVKNIELICALCDRLEFDPRVPPLAVAVEWGQHEVALALLNSGCEVDRGALASPKQACLRGSAWRDVVEFLCVKITLGQADLPPGKRGRGAVHWACESGSAAIVKAVCGRADVDVNRVGQLGHCGLYCALGRTRESELVEMARILFDRGFTLDGERLGFIKDVASLFNPLPVLVEFLFERGLNPRAQVQDGGTVSDILRPQYGEVLARMCVP
jgi:hypothetical protein